MKKCCFLLAFSLLLGVFCLPLVGSAEAADGYYHGELTSESYWIPAHDKMAYDLYRLPGIVVSKAGTVIVYGEARNLSVNQDGYGSPSNHDLCEMDLYLRRSTDGGESFGDKIYIARGADYYARGLGETINNPCMIVGNDGRLHLLFGCNVASAGLWYTYSDDDALTWSEPVNIVQNGMDTSVAWSQLICGPGHGICLDDGTLMVSAGLNFKAARTLYSKDNGKTWKFSDQASINKDETCIVELSNGAIMLNSRQYSLPYDEANPPRSPEEAYRALSISQDGKTEWSTTKFHKTLIDPGCQGSMCSVDLEGLPYAILFVNNASKTDRNHITVRCSFNDGETWEKSILIDERCGGYSDIAVDQNGKVYVIYEEALGQRVHLATFSFYDAFCKDDPTVTSQTTAFQAPYSLLGEKSGVTTACGEGNALDITVEDLFEATVEMDVTSITQNISLDETPYLGLRVKAQVAADTDTVKAGVYLHCGPYQTSKNSLYTSFTIPNDGQYHNVRIDLTGREGFGGNFYSVELALILPSSDVTKGDKFSVSGMEFFATKDALNAAYGDKTEPTGEAGGDTPDEGGCKSTVGVAALPVILLLSAGCVLSRKRSRKQA